MSTWAYVLLTALVMFWLGFLISAALGMRRYEELDGALRWLARDPQSRAARDYARDVLEG